MYWVYLINNVILISLFTWYNSKLFVQMKVKKSDCLILFIIVILKSLSNLCNSFQVNLFFTIFTYFFISLIYFKGSGIKKIFFICFFLITSFISEMSAYVFLSQLSFIYEVKSNSFLYILLGNGVSAVYLFTIVFLITKINGLKDMIDTKKIWYFITFPIISIMIIYCIMNSNLLENYPILYTLISVGLITFNIVLCKGFSDIIKLKNNEIENEKLKSQNLHYLLLEEKMVSSKRLLHDFKKHINILNGYANYQEYEKIEEYLNKLSTEIKVNDYIFITGNQLIDLSLSANKKIMDENSIAIKFDIQVRELYPVSDYDFNIIFSNIIDNALESCLRTHGYFIKIKLVKVYNLIILKVTNPCFEVNINLVTLKENKEDHGNGIKNIDKIVKKYNGVSTFEFDEKNKLFISTVIFEC